ncbi:hypothetical Protein YC6258_00239 [Gynuella sunshinyii YC6258]|uniref:Uncharacterized protein n=1 Tax=Gynuella sunshinyii YC6258 TaxID=1445510 RepID=A0A0C5VDM3_9GAMM|nr:hypothetical Protein YC6258_00239 [Gynuella sunshinyii YC6258]
MQEFWLPYAALSTEYRCSVQFIVVIHRDLIIDSGNPEKVIK